MNYCNGEVKEEPEKLAEMYPPKKGPSVPIGDVFTSCNWVIRDGCVVRFFTFSICQLCVNHTGPQRRA